jgi:hypothetical protein
MNFSMKIAYHLEKERSMQCKGESSKASVYNSVWKRIWKLETPKVVKMFLWRACNNLVPTKENLFRKRIVRDSLYPIFGLDERPLAILFGVACHQQMYELNATKRFRHDPIVEMTLFAS